MKKILVTGSAGFIGFHISNLLLDNDFSVVGVDGITDYYDVKLKLARNEILRRKDNYKFYTGLIQDREFLGQVWENEKPDIVIHLAAQAGVRYSIENPQSYLESNIVGTFNILELAKTNRIKHILIASTSSVYGANPTMPFDELQPIASPMSFYAATKASIENISHSYSHIYNLPTTIFRFFTVYGPWGRPDMALFKFTDAIINNQPIDVYNFGKMKRDFTFIDDLVEAIFRLINVTPSNQTREDLKIKNDSLSSVAPWRVVNIGNAEAIDLMAYIKQLEYCLGKKADMNFLNIQQGDVPMTLASNTLLKQLTGFQPSTSTEVGIKKFVSWYKDYYLK